MSLYKDIFVLQPNPGCELSNENKEVITYAARGILNQIIAKRFKDSKQVPPELWFVTNNSRGTWVIDQEMVRKFLGDILENFGVEYLVNNCSYTKDHAELTIKKALKFIHFEQEVEELCNHHELIDKFLCIIRVIEGRSEIRIFTARGYDSRIKELLQKNWNLFRHHDCINPEKVKFINSTEYFDLKWRGTVEEILSTLREHIFR